MFITLAALPSASGLTAFRPAAETLGMAIEIPTPTLRVCAVLLPVLYRAAAGELAGIAEMVTPDRSVGGRRLARGVLLWAAWM